MARVRIGFVVEPYEESEESGMGYSVRETAKALAANQDYDLTLYSRIPLRKDLIPGEYTNVLVPKSLLGKFFFFLRRPKEVDLLFFVVALLPLWIPSHTRTVLICKELPDHKLKSTNPRENLIRLVRDRLLMPRCVRRAERILASSEATVGDLGEFYQVPREKIDIIYEGYQDWMRYTSEAPAIDPAWLPYFLFTGKVKSRKNVHGIVAAFIALRERTKSKAKLLIVGSYGGEYYAEMATALREHHLEDQVHFLGYVSAPMMYSLYTNALALVFPSFSEGFGMPIVEAMSLGLPVITSNISSLVEVVGDAGIRVDPYDTVAISEAMEQMEEDAALRAASIEKGFEQAKLFSWAKVGERYHTIISKLSYDA